MTIINTTYARPYAKAAFEYALTNNDIAAWSQMLQAASMIASDHRVKALLIDPNVTQEEIFSLFNDICGALVNDARRNFLQLLVSRRRLNVLPEIATLFKRFQAEHEQTVVVDVISFSELTDEQTDQLRRSLSQRLNRNVTLTCRVDEELLGGAIVRARDLDLVIDGSVRSQLVSMANEIVA